jgi:hypothetical protein
VNNDDDDDDDVTGALVTWLDKLAKDFFVKKLNAIVSCQKSTSVSMAITQKCNVTK